MNLSPTACWERLKRLEEGGLLRGYRAEVVLSKIAVHVSVFVTVELESHRGADFQRFEAAIQRYEVVVAC